MEHILWPEGAPHAKGGEEDHRPWLDCSPLRGAEPAPAVVVCPGGGYGMRADHEGRPVAKWLNSLGIAAFVCHYRVAPYKNPAPLLDAQRAIRTVRASAGEWNIDPERVGILGFSAGGHLAATAGTHFDSGDPSANDPIDRQSSRPSLMILCYPVITFTEYRHHGSMINLIGEDAPEDLRHFLSGEKQVTEQTPPAFLWHTADDAGVPVQNSLLMADALSRNGVPFALHVFQRGRHGLGLAEEELDVAQWTTLCAGWLKTQGF
ncbi:MAG TPA: alpha/beta hydrolase [Capsulimonadaceae bacterium]|nr:alpha/beta hydrolase [Capsulimonadaceae bacterium]